MRKGFVIAIDGPVASGKGTIALTLANRIHAVNINTGGIWRAYTYILVNQNQIPSPDTIAELRRSQVTLDIRDNGSFDVLINDEVVTEHLTDPKISEAVSRFGVTNEFAKFIIAESRRVALEFINDGKTIIMEGRQIGTVVFPDADAKIFLTADIETRAKRRQLQYKQKGIIKSLDEVIQETKVRDENDMSREVGALPRVPEKLGYEVIDNSEMDEEATLQAILDILERNKIWQQN